MLEDDQISSYLKHSSPLVLLTVIPPSIPSLGESFYTEILPMTPNKQKVIHGTLFPSPAPTEVFAHAQRYT